MDCVEHFANYRQLTDGSFAVRVSNDLTDPVQIDVLTHEMAHVLSWTTCTNDHGRKWGQQYAVVYQAYCDWFDEVSE